MGFKVTSISILRRPFKFRPITINTWQKIRCSPCCTIVFLGIVHSCFLSNYLINLNSNQPVWLFCQHNCYVSVICTKMLCLCINTIHKIFIGYRITDCPSRQKGDHCQTMTINPPNKKLIEHLNMMKNGPHTYHLVMVRLLTKHV